MTFIPGREYVWGNLVSSANAPVYTYIGADGDKHVFRKSDSHYIALGYNNTPDLIPKPEPFFEVGKTYRRKTNDQIRFEVARVETNASDGTPIAFGRIYGRGLKAGIDHWDIKGRWTYENENWEEVA